MALTTTKPYRLIVWWENPTETVYITGGSRKHHSEFIVRSGTHTTLWTVRGIIEIDTTTHEDGTFWLRRNLTIQLNRDPYKTRNFDFKLLASPGQGYGVLDFCCQVDPYGGFEGDGVYTSFDFFTSTPSRVVRRTLKLPPQQDGITTHPLNIWWECSGQWGCKYTVEFELSALLT